MKLELQVKIKNNPLYIRFLRENSMWYKILNRYPNQFKEFEENVKKTYQLRLSDRFSKLTQYLELFQTIVSNIK